MARRSARFISIPYSHYNERARWALDFAHVPYIERPALPLVHMLPVIRELGLRGGKSDSVSTRFSTPMLVTSEGVAIPDSTDIVTYANEYPAVSGLRGRLRPTPEVESWEQQFHDVAGPHVRRLAYFYLFQDIDRIRDLLRITMPGWQATFGILTLPLLRGAIFRLLNVNERASARSLEKVQEQFRVASEHLDAQKAAGRVDATGQPFFVGTEFTAADLTWASLVAPILVIQPEEGLNIGLPKLETAGTPEFRDLVRHLRASTAGQHALRMYREFRSPSARVQLDPMHDILVVVTLLSLTLIAIPLALLYGIVSLVL